MAWVRSARLALIPLVAAACGGDAGPPARSAGPADTAAWSLEPVALARGGGEGLALHNVFSGFLRPDGSFVAGNSGGRQVLLFGPDGSLRRASGRQGMGPGEFQGVNWVRPLPGDSVLVFDMMARRFSVLDSAGGFVRAFSIETPMGMPRPLGIFADGTVLAAEEGRFDPRRATGTVRDRMALYRAARTGEVLRELGEFDAAEWLRYGDGTAFRTTRLTLGRAGHVALLRDRLVYGSSDAASLEVLDERGARVGRIPLPLVPRRVTDAEREAFVQSLVEDLPPARRGGTRQALRSVPMPEHAPLFTRLLGGGDGNLWVEVPAAGGAAKWIVVRTDGRTLGSLWLPPGTHPLDVRGDVMLVRTVAEDGEERVAVHRLRR